MTYADTAAHKPVLLRESVNALAIQPDHILVDGTFGRGGHSKALLGQLGEAGRLIVFDQDPAACAEAARLAADDARVTVVRSNFSDMASRLDELGVLGRVNGLMLDLGVSSPQLDEAGRGFSFMRDGPLDMRMDPDAGVSAADWLATVGIGELQTVLRELGEERQARRIAHAIVAARDEAPITRTGQLAKLIEAAVGGRRGRRIHPATRSFQAIRMHINHELESLRTVLDQLESILAVGGRAAIISFHSLEDRIVKHFFRERARPKAPDPVSPPPPPSLRVCGRAMCEPDEAAANPRARSAVLRWVEKLR